ncbi:MAG: NADPH:quinone reductase [Rhodospirillaceae bacterium]|nr:NADPH:quinone reductase [Rhodospirillaceae bacterium]
MRGVLVKEYTEFENLTLEDCPRPQLNPGHVRIKVQAAGVSFATSLVVAGKYQRKPPLPFTPGTEAAGYVSEVGKGVKDFSIGDRICAVLDWGGQAEEATAHAANVFKIQDSLSFSKAICFTNSYATSYAALVWPHLLHIQPGETALIHGATGGVGVAATEICKVKGATVIATVGTDQKRAIAAEHGADYTINYREQNFRDEVLALTDGIGVNVIYDPVGGEVFAQSLRCIAPEGRIMPIGFANGTIQQIPANILLVKNITVCGLNMGYYFGWSPRDVREEYGQLMKESMAELFHWFEEGKLSPRVSHVFPLEGFQEAMTTVLSRRALGRVALVMDEEARRLGVS